MKPESHVFCIFFLYFPPILGETPWPIPTHRKALPCHMRPSNQASRLSRASSEVLKPTDDIVLNCCPCNNRTGLSLWEESALRTPLQPSAHTRDWLVSLLMTGDREYATTPSLKPWLIVLSWAPSQSRVLSLNSGFELDLSLGDRVNVFSRNTWEPSQPYLFDLLLMRDQRAA